MSSVLDEVLARVNILDIISQYVKLRKTGRNFIGLCPFHKEKTPSFTVSPEKQIYYCFGCHEGGNVVNFLAKYDRSTFQEALENLANQVGIATSKRVGARRTPVFDALSRLAEYYQANLARSDFAMRYLRERNIDKQAVEAFKLGYSERRSYTKDFAKRLGIPLDMLLSTGVVKLKDGGEGFDIFRGRITIPILDINGKVIGFGGRAMGKDVLPKYINSPESPVFSKRSVLYGLDKAKREIAERDEAIIVEGYFDLISVYSAGVRNAVATLGTSITEEQVSRLRNYTENITLMLDGDEAGVKSALRLITLFGEMGINGNMVVLPDGHDPDSLIRQQGIAGFAAAIGKKKPLLDYFFDFHIRKHGIDSLEGRLSFIRSVVPHLQSMRDAVKRRLYVQRLSELTGVEEYRFWDSMKERHLENRLGGEEESRRAIEEKVVGILITKPDLIELFTRKEVKAYIRDTGLCDLLSRLLDYYQTNGAVDLKLFLNVLEKPQLRETAVSSTMHVADYDEQEMVRIVSDYLSYTENKLMCEEARGITEKLAQAEKNGDERALMELLEQKRSVLTAMKNKSAK
ncbi:MAG: DNA primase [Syntrophorhabdaceae bacterium PtaU1.Bin034]|jgi:DNA primase|nr:MAG: DNA primase [Syntrophorhabdaceae bacterium PtaU1.Bin034]